MAIAQRDVGPCEGGGALPRRQGGDDVCIIEHGEGGGLYLRAIPQAERESDGG